MFFRTAIPCVLSLGLFALGAAACGGTSVASVPLVNAPPPEVVAAPNETPVAETEPPSVVHRLDPCTEGPEHDLVASLADGAIVRSAEAAAPPSGGATIADLDRGLISLTSTGERVASFMRVDLGEPAETFLAAISFHESDPIEDSGVMPWPSLHLLRCVPSEGYRAAVGVPLWERAATWIAGRELVTIGSTRFVTLRVVSDFVATEERREDAFVIAHPDVPLIRSSQRAPAHGILPVIGTVARSYVAEGADELTTESAYDATGWFVEGDHGAYVTFVRETRPGPRGFHVTSFPRALVIATGGELHEALFDSGFTPFYLLLGRGESPSLCHQRAGVTCRRLTMHGDVLPELDYAWVAGVFATDDATLPTISVRGARWLYVAREGSTPPRRGPDGRPPLTRF